VAGGAHTLNIPEAHLRRQESGREAVETSSRQASIKFPKPPKPAIALVYLTEIATQGNFYTKRRERLLAGRLYQVVRCVRMIGFYASSMRSMGPSRRRRMHWSKFRTRGTTFRLMETL